MEEAPELGPRAGAPLSAADRGTSRRSAGGARPALEPVSSPEVSAALAQLLGSVHVAVVTATVDGRLLAANAAFEALLGYSDRELSGMDFIELTHPDDVDESWAMRGVLAERGHVRWEKRYIRKDGEPVWVDVSVAVVGDASGEPRFEVVVVLDLTERKALEELLLQSQKLSGVGRLAGGVAHDFNNLLMAIIGYASRIVANRDATAGIRHEAVEITRVAERASQISGQLLAFSRGQRLDPRTLDLSALVRSTMSMLDRLIGDDVAVHTRLGENLRAVRADRTQLEQVVLNLVLNARDAMPNGGALTIETRAAGKDRVELVVSDTGVGIDAATRERMFEPFFTTKPGAGNGIGLATVCRIVEQSGGEITVESSPGNGADFRISLPAVGTAPAPDGAPEPIAGSTETVLVVEDEEALRRLARRVLSDHGFAVLEAADGKQALSLVEEAEGQIDLVLIDVVMPSLSGPELGQRLSMLDPRPKVVYMSGYLDAGDADSTLARGAEFIAKPFTPRGLIAKLREVLDAA